MYNENEYNEKQQQDETYSLDAAKGILNGMFLGTLLWIFVVSIVLVIVK